MKSDANDPKWTAYALGEITDEKERAEIENILEESAEMRRLVEEIRQTAGLLTAELKEEPPINLTHAQRKRIEKKILVARTWFGLKPAWVMASAAAAVLLISILTVRQLVNFETTPAQDQIAQATLKAPAVAPPPVLERPRASASPGTAPRKDSAGAKRGAEATVQEKMEVAAVRPSAVLPGEKPGLAVPVDPLQSAPAPVPSQPAQNAVLAGTIKDAAGSVLSGVTLKVKDDSTGTLDQTVSNAAGQYSFPALKPGFHTLTANLPGFQTTTYTQLALNSASPTRLDINMEVKSLEQTVEVSAAASGLLLESSSSGFLPNQPAKALTLAAGNVPDRVRVTGGSTLNDMRYRHPMPPMPPPKGLMPPWRKPGAHFNTEAYDNITDNPFLEVTENPLSTFSIDVDTASYSNVRRYLDNGSLPPKDAVRIEELVNYFDYDYKGPKNDKPFAASFEITEAPWNPEHRLLRIGLKAREIAPGRRPDSNLVFLLDVSGSMADYNKLPLVKESMNLLVDKLTEADRVAIVVYASDTSLYLPSTSGDQKEKLRHAIERLHAGGSTNGASGIQLAYQTARENFIKGGVNRIILATDGDFNVGITNRGDLTRLIEEQAKSGIFLSALGFGMGNYKDSTLELLANKGRGNYAYIDTINEAKKVLAEQINSTLVTIAKDVKLQVEFNPQRVSAYRLIGYEDRLMAKEDFNDDAKQAGVIGAGHAVTALYELVPVGSKEQRPGVDPLKYQKPAQPSVQAAGDELLTLKIRSKEPEKDTSVMSEFAVRDSKEKFSDASQDFKFAASVAAFGMVLRDSPYKGNADMERALEWAKEGRGADIHGYRQEFIRLIHRAVSISF